MIAAISGHVRSVLLVMESSRSAPFSLPCDVEAQAEVGVFEDTRIVVQCFLRYMRATCVLAQMYGFKHVPFVEPEVHGQIISSIGRE